jgi:calcineurin-like phosphoesterase family protein
MTQINKDTFIVSDTHFSHANILTFKREDGQMVRPGFSSYEEMDEYIVNKWNSVVKPDDKVYHLGDVVMKKRYIDIVKRLNGKKRLIMGNHDIFPFGFYQDYFEEVYAMRFLPQEGIMMTHIPLNLQCIKKYWINVHGHIHEKIIGQDTQMVLGNIEDQHPYYYNVCVEHHDYTPVSMDVIRDKIKNLKDISI